MNDFDRFWEAYPSRKGDRAKQPAMVLFEKIVKSGVNPEDIIHGARKFAELEKDKIGTTYIMQAQRWLRNKRWLDFSVAESPNTGLSASFVGLQVFVKEGTPQWKAWQEYLVKMRGKRSPIRNFGWWFPTEWPPQEGRTQ